jgi:hypothetical protein
MAHLRKIKKYYSYDFFFIFYLFYYFFKFYRVLRRFDPFKSYDILIKNVRCPWTRSNEPFVVGNTGWGRNDKVLRKSHGNRENPVPEVARTPLTYVGQALPGPSTPSLFILDISSYALWRSTPKDIIKLNSVLYILCCSNKCWGFHTNVFVFSKHDAVSNIR